MSPTRCNWLIWSPSDIKWQQSMASDCPCPVCWEWDITRVYDRKVWSYFLVEDFATIKFMFFFAFNCKLNSIGYIMYTFSSPLSNCAGNSNASYGFRSNQSRHWLRWIGRHFNWQPVTGRTPSAEETSAAPFADDSSSTFGDRGTPQRLRASSWVELSNMRITVNCEGDNQPFKKLVGEHPNKD